MPDEVLPCVDCKTEFTFTASEATFFTSKGLSKPRRCKPCRQKRRDAKPDGGSPTVVQPPPRQETQWVNAEEDAPRKNARKRRRDYDRGP